MKRTLFWAVSMFALGEVAYLYADRIVKYSIALAMLICVVMILLKKIKYIRLYIFFVVSFLLGFGYIMLRDSISPISYAESTETNAKIIQYEDYRVISQGKNISQSYCLNAEGIVTNVKVADQGINITIKFGKGVCSYKVIIYGVREDYKVGDKVCIEGVVNTISSPTNVGVMNMYTYYRARGIFFSGQGNEVLIEKIGFGGDNIFEDAYYKMLSWLTDVRGELSEQLDKIANKKTATFFKGILLGEKDYIDDYTGKLYQINGIAHILVISGLHISMLGGLVFKMFSIVGLGQGVSAVLSIVMVVLYGAMSGMGFATLRAVIMLIVSMVGGRLSRDYDMVTSMSLSLAIMLLIEPFRILDGGIWLSYGAVSGVIMGRYIMRLLDGKSKIKRLKRKRKKLYNLLWSVTISLSVNIVISPIILSLYFELPVYSLITNMLVVPIMSVVLILGILGLGLSYVSLIWGWLVYIPAGYIIKYITSLCEFITGLPFNMLNCGSLSIWSIILYYSCLITILLFIKPKVQGKIRHSIHERFHIWLDYKRWKYIYVGIIVVNIILCAFGIFAIEKIKEKSFVYFADVGQGDGILIRTKDGVNMVIDGGSTSNQNVGEYVMTPVIKYFGMANIDYWFITHGDSDHTNGLEYILKQGDLSGIHIDNIVVSNLVEADKKLLDLIEQAEGEGINIIYMTAGDKLVSGNCELTCVAPFNDMDYEDGNQASLGLLYLSGEVSMLFTGDMDEKAIAHMYQKCVDIFSPQISVLKVPHHGSKHSICSDFLEYIKPNISVISAGRNNIYGHPHEETLDALESIESRIFSTDNMGGVVIELE